MIQFRKSTLIFIEVFQILLETSKVALRHNKTIAQNILDDFSLEVFEVDGGEWRDTDGKGHWEFFPSNDLLDIPPQCNFPFMAFSEKSFKECSAVGSLSTMGLERFTTWV